MAEIYKMREMMNRRESIVRLSAGLGVTSVGMAGCNSLPGRLAKPKRKELMADLVIIGGGLGGCSAALSALRSGLAVVMTEETDWIGGQLTSQGVPPDEHRWIESFGCTRTYRKFRSAIRHYYRRHYPLTDKVQQVKNFNPGSGSVSRLCHEPRVALACLESLLAPFEVNGQLTLLMQTKPIAAELVSDNIRSVEVFNMGTGHSLILTGSIFADATELGDLLPLANCEHVTGTEGKKQTGELHMPDRASPGNQQAFTTCFAVDHVVGAEHVIDKPKGYDFWSGYIPDLIPAWPGRLLDFTYTHPSSGASKQLGFNPKGPHKIGVINLWTYRRILAQSNFKPGSGFRDISLINWPQNDYFLGNLVGVSDAERNRHIARSKQLSLSLLHWLQTEAPRDDGGEGWPGLRLRKDVMGTDDGMAKYPYVREARRIKALITIVEQDCGRENRALMLGIKENQVRGKRYHDSVGVGHYQIDLHPSTGGDNYIDFGALPFELPLGALIPQRVNNLIASCKNIGTTHITNGCYRLHPVEWNIGEVAGHLAAISIANSVQPRAIRESAKLLSSFQERIRKSGVETRWPENFKI